MPSFNKTRNAQRGFSATKGIICDFTVICPNLLIFTYMVGKTYIYNPAKFQKDIFDSF